MATEHAYDNGDKYLGEMRDGKRQGQGTYTDTEGHTFTGTWANDGLMGQGKYKGEDGEYDGQWNDNLKHGQGTFTWTNGEKYVGQWVDDNMNGSGDFNWTNGKAYSGQWLDGLRNGNGVLNFPNGSKYDGEWLNDKCHGYGRYTEASGEYEGMWEDNKKHGHGIYKYADGRRYDGQWVYDKKTEGLVYTPDGGIFRVKFSETGEVVSQEAVTQDPPKPKPAPKPVGALGARIAAFGGGGAFTGGAGGAAEPKTWDYKKSIPYDDLKLPSKHTRPEIDVANRDRYLSDADFQSVFRMDRGTFEALPQWKRNQRKKAVQLF